MRHVSDGVVLKMATERPTEADIYSVDRLAVECKYRTRKLRTRFYRVEKNHTSFWQCIAHCQLTN